MSNCSHQNLCILRYIKPLACHRETQASRRASKLNGSRQNMANSKEEWFPLQSKDQQVRSRMDHEGLCPLWGRRVREKADVRALVKSYKSWRTPCAAHVLIEGSGPGLPQLPLPFVPTFCAFICTGSGDSFFQQIFLEALLTTSYCARSRSHTVFMSYPFLVHLVPPPSLETSLLVATRSVSLFSQQRLYVTRLAGSEITSFSILTGLAKV